MTAPSITAGGPTDRFGQLVRSRVFLGIVGVVAAILIWRAASTLVGTGGGRIARLASPLEVAREVGNYLAGDFLADVGSSLAVFALGWAIGGALATLLGLVLGRATVARGIVLPVIEGFRPVSSIVWVPLSIVWFGFGLTSKVFLVGLAVFLVVIVYSVSGASRIAPYIERAASMLGMNRFQRMRYVVLGSMMTEVMIGLRVALMAGWGTVIVAELVASNSGIGSHLIHAQQAYEIPAVMAAMVCFGAVGFVLNAAFALIERLVQPWQKGAGRA